MSTLYEIKILLSLLRPGEQVTFPESIFVAAVVADEQAWREAHPVAEHEPIPWPEDTFYDWCVRTGIYCQSQKNQDAIVFFKLPEPP